MGTVTIVDLEQAQADCGSKAYGLGRLLRSGARVPPGFVVLDDPDPAEVARAVEHLTGPLAVRSSGLAEDTAAASFAGQLETVLGVVGVDQTLAAIATCRASGRSSRARAYAARMQAPAESHVPVIVQQLVPADVAGVAFTRDPRSGAHAVAIEAAWGLGESVVSGRVIPDAFTVVAAGEVEATTGSKATRLDHRDGVLRRTAVAAADRRRQVLTHEQAAEVADAALQAEAVHGTSVDVEWAIAGDTLWLLQVRPITGVTGRRERLDAPVGEAIVQGVGASPGRVSGTVRIVRDLDGFGAVEPGDVLVCRTTDPAWTPLFGIAAAVVTETGGVLSHAAIVARELGVPAVVGASQAQARLAGIASVVVDGDNGTVASLQ